MSSNSPLRLIVAGGGTGGHVHPALAVLQELRQREIPLDVLWIGSSDGIEGEIASREAIAFEAIPTGKLRRYLDVKTAKDAMNIPMGVIKARQLVTRFKPDVVLSTGGFVSVPTVIASRRRYPILTHEQTTILGLATKINMRSCNVLALSFDTTASLVRNSHVRSVVTGNPIRTALLEGDANRGRERFDFDDRLPVIYVTGGARGASAINERIKSIIGAILGSAQVIHQTGPASANNDFATLTAYRDTLPDNLKRRYVLTEFIGSEIADVYAMSDLVVSRSGAGTVAEIAALGKPAIMIPLQPTGGDEQVVNARSLAGRDAGVMILQNEATPDRLLGEIRRLLNDTNERIRMAAAAKAIGRPDAGSLLTDEILKLAKRI